MMPLYSDPKAPTPIRVEQQPELDPSLVAANRRFMQSRDQARYLIHKTARDESDAQAGSGDTDEMRALKLGKAYEELMAAKMANTGATREEVMPEVEAEMAQRLLQPDVESAAAREAARLGRGGVERVGFRQVWGQRQEVLKQAGAAVDSGDGAIVSQILGVQAKYDTAPDAFQKAWTVGGVRMSPSEVRQKVLDKAGQMVTQAMHEPFAPTPIERGRAEIKRKAEDALLPGVERAPTKPKPIEWKAEPGITGVFYNSLDPSQKIDTRGTTYDVIHTAGGNVLEIEKNGKGEVVAVREKYLKPKDVDYTEKTVSTEKDGVMRDVTYWVAPGEKAKEVEGIPWPATDRDVQEMPVYELGEKGVQVPVIVRVRAGVVISKQYPAGSDGRGRMSAEMEKRFKESPKRYVSTVNVLNRLGQPTGEYKTRITFSVLDETGKETGKWQYYEAQPAASPTEAGGAPQPAAPQAAAPALPHGGGAEADDATKEQAVKMLEDQGLPVTEDNLQAILAKYGWTSRL
jgi:hypothetical protein